MAKRRWFRPSRNVSLRLALYGFVMTGIVLLANSMAGYSFAGKIIRQNTAYYAQNYVRSMNSEINFYMRDIDLMTLTLFYMNDRNLFALLGDSINKLELRSYFDGFINTRDYVYDIFLVSGRGEVAGTTSVTESELFRSDFYRKLEESGGELVVAPIGHPSFVQDRFKAKQEVLLAGRKIKSPQTNRTEGYVLLTLAADRLKQVLDKPDKQYDEKLLLVDRQGGLLYPANPGDLPLAALNRAAASGKASARAMGYLIVSGGSGQPDPINVVGVIPEKGLLKDAAKIRNLLFGLNFLLLLIGLALAVGLSYRFLRPVVRLSSHMRTVGRGEWVPYSRRDMKDEIGVLIVSFNRMIRRLQRLFRRLEAERGKQKKAELRALQAQINPHFVYNTLNNVRWLARMGDTEAVFHILTEMNEILVSAFRLERPLIPIGEELKHLRAYVSIEQMIYPDQFEVFYEVDEEVLEGRIARMSLQPLLENAIFHGVLPKAGVGHIRVKGWREDGRIFLQVTDDGAGAAACVNDDREGASREHVGMINVDRRIRLYFGEAYGVQWHSVPGSGTTVTVTLPDVERTGGTQ